MAMKQNALDYKKQYPQAVKAVLELFMLMIGWLELNLLRTPSNFKSSFENSSTREDLHSGSNEANPHQLLNDGQLSE